MLEVWEKTATPPTVQQTLEIYLDTPGQRTFLVPASDIFSNDPTNPTQVVVTVAGLAASDTIIATLTDPTNGTSAFSASSSSIAPPNVVNNTNDTGAGSLRSVIQYIDSPGRSFTTIDFDIPAGPFVITPKSALPAITLPTTIDGTSQPGYVPSNAIPVIEIDGGGGAFDGLVLGPGSDGSTVEGLSIYDFTMTGTGGLHIESGHDTIIDNWIGISPSSGTATGNGVGILIDGSFNVIGGITAANVIGNNTVAGVSITGIGATHNQLLGNDIGVDPTNPRNVLANAIGVVIDGGASSNTIGNTLAGTAGLTFSAVGNTSGGLVSKMVTLDAGFNTIGFNATGVSISGQGTSHNVVQENYVGTDAGNFAQGNDVGILLDGAASDNAVGGTIATDTQSDKHGVTITGTVTGNVIGFNTKAGVSISGTATGNFVQGNYVGTDALGDRLGNAIGVSISAASNIIGGGSTVAGTTVTAAGNIVSANSGSGSGANSGDGILLARADSNTILGNTIGATTTAAGVSFFGNQGNGLELDNSSGNQIGGSLTVVRAMIGGKAVTINALDPNLANIIVGNVGDGVLISDTNGDPPTPAADTIQGNLISRNSSDGVGVVGDLTGDQSLALISDNFIGTDPSGLYAFDPKSGQPFGNALSGIELKENVSGTSSTGSLGATVSGNVTSGNGLSGVTVDSSSSSTNNNFVVAVVNVSGNIIGLDSLGQNAVQYNSATATALPLGNVLDGVLIDNVVGVTVGGTLAVGTVQGAGNIISGNLGRGIEVRGDLLNVHGNDPNTGAPTVSLMLTLPNVIEGNDIGTDITGQSGSSVPPNSPNTNSYTLGNLSDGVFLFDPANTNILDNVISNNRGAGIHAATDVNQSSGGSPTTGSVQMITGNSIGMNATSPTNTISALEQRV